MNKFSVAENISDVNPNRNNCHLFSKKTEQSNTTGAIRELLAQALSNLPVRLDGLGLTVAVTASDAERREIGKRLLAIQQPTDLLLKTA